MPSYRKNDPEYDITWSADAKYVYDERIAILTDGRMEPTIHHDRIARSEARSFHIAEVSARASGDLHLKFCGQ